MTLQEKIDRLPLSIEYNGFGYDFNLFGRDEQVYIEYGCLDDEGFEIEYISHWQPIVLPKKEKL